MATDVARVSFDPARLYRGVVHQQGRVSLEAEQNEQRVIEAEEGRQALIDIVGPAGTPDDGYAISGGSDFTVGPGTMYVGGWRLELEEPGLQYSAQPDWLDRPAEDSAGGFTGNQHVVLMVRETDVTAVEDSALYEVSLGGPDGAGRTRLIQHVLRLPTDATTCSAALAADVKAWAGQGLTFDPETMALESDSRLLVNWEGDPKPPDPCEPSSVGGYLGAENQLIRVQLTRVDATQGTFDLIWGYDDASFLYRVTPDASTNPILTLERSPVDDFHRPRAGQAVQVLRAAAELQSTDGVVEGYVAALGGEVAVLAAPYDPDSKTVQFPAPLLAAYAGTKQLYLRVWEGLLPNLHLGVPVTLPGTGMRITITASAGGSLHVDDFWCIAVRPSTPTTVYPDRYLRAPQPPDGPRQWVCPLAVIAWQTESLVVLDDCRNHFKPLVDTTANGCCTIEVRPSDAASGKLQALIDKAAAGRASGARPSRVTVCFEPGRYELEEPLILRKFHSNLTLSGCSEAAEIAVQAGREAAFGHGLVILADADNVTLSGLEFVLPQVPAALAKVSATTGGVFTTNVVSAVNSVVANRYVSIGLRPLNCAVLEIADCVFRFSLGEHATTPQVAQTMPREVFGVGVFAVGECWGLRIRRSRFLHHASGAKRTDGPQHLLVGYLLTQTPVPRGGVSKARRSLGAARLRALIEDAEITDNEFHGLTAAIVIEAVLGDVRVWDNIIRDCYAGVWLSDAAAATYTDFSGTYPVKSADLEQVGLVRTAMAGGLRDPLLTHLLVLGAFYPLPQVPDFVVSNVSEVPANLVAKASRESANLQQSRMSQLVARIAADHPMPPDASGQAAAPPPPDFNTVPLLDGVPAANDNVLLAWAALRDLSRLDRSAAPVKASLRIERNDADCTPVARGQRSGPALFLYTSLLDKEGGTAMVASNRLTSQHATVVAVVIGASAATITGNIIVGPAEVSVALAVGAIGAVAITGNVVKGRNWTLPMGRPFAAPLDSWEPLNTLVRI